MARVSGGAEFSGRLVGFEKVKGIFADPLRIGSRAGN